MKSIKKSIKNRLLWSYLVITILTVLLLECLIFFSVRKYYISSMEDILIKQSKIASNFFNKYIAYENLYNKSNSLLQSFSANTSAQVQILDSKGLLLSDTMNQYTSQYIKSPDVQSAINRNLGKWHGTTPNISENIIAISHPLITNNKLVGVVRYISSLNEMNLVLSQLFVLLIIIGLLVISGITLVSIAISSTITRPIKKITETAEIMAKGNYSIKANKDFDDELGKLSDTLNYMCEEILRNEKLKNEFIASVSHELRTPLTSIKGWVITILSEKNFFNDDIKQGLKIIETETDRLTYLVEDLLDFSKLYSKSISLQSKKICISDLLVYVIKQVSPRINRHNIELKINLQNDIFIIGDENRLKQVMLNIIDNSIKFTPNKGEILINLYTTNNNAIISIEDTGCGISDRDLSKVKNKFYKTNHNKSGSGLGLAISEEIIRLHKGSLHIKSKLGEGTKTIIHLPL